MLEDWIDRMGLPQGVQSHLSPVRDLLTWLQVRIPNLILRRIYLIDVESVIHN